MGRAVDGDGGRQRHGARSFKFQVQN
jgi:hypothetical protein